MLTLSLNGSYNISGSFCFLDHTHQMWHMPQTRHMRHMPHMRRLSWRARQTSKTHASSIFCITRAAYEVHMRHMRCICGICRCICRIWGAYAAYEAHMPRTRHTLLEKNIIFLTFCETKLFFNKIIQNKFFSSLHNLS